MQQYFGSAAEFLNFSQFIEMLTHYRIFWNILIVKMRVRPWMRSEQNSNLLNIPL